MKTHFIIALIVCPFFLFSTGPATAGQDVQDRLRTKKPSSLRDRLDDPGPVTVGRRADPQASPARADIRGRKILSTQGAEDGMVSADPAPGEIIEEYAQYWNGSSWVNDVRWLYSYDSAGNFIQEVRQFWSVNAWVNQNRWTMEYDGDGNDTTEVREYWSSNMWVPDFKWSYS